MQCQGYLKGKIIPWAELGLEMILNKYFRQQKRI